jgi:hypothetical protein
VSASTAAQLRAAQLPAKHRRAPPTSGHAVPQAPQFAASVAVVTSHPSAARALQSARPLVQLATVHAPATQAPVALAGAQRLPHAPQCSALARVSTSQPLEASPSQSAKPASQA